MHSTHLAQNRSFIGRRCNESASVHMQLRYNTWTVSLCLSNKFQISLKAYDKVSSDHSKC